MDSFYWNTVYVDLPPRPLGTLIPCLVLWMNGKSFGIGSADFGILLFCVWATIVWSSHTAQFPRSSLLACSDRDDGRLFLARCFVRTAEDSQVILHDGQSSSCVCCHLLFSNGPPGRKPLIAMFQLHAPDISSFLAELQLRWVGYRAQGVFAHPILFGLFCASVVGLTHVVLGRDRTVAPRWLLTGAVAFTASLSMSSAPIAAVALQIVCWHGTGS